MKVLIVSEGYGEKRYGVAQVIMRLGNVLQNNDIDYSIVVPRLDGGRNHNGVITLAPGKNAQMYYWHPQLTSFFVEQMTAFKPEIVHAHGIFTFLQQSALTVSAMLKVPSLLSPHGMLDPWLWRFQGGLRYRLKRALWHLCLKPTLGKATVMHAITGRESREIRSNFPEIPQIQIPNAIDLDATPKPKPAQEPAKSFLFLGRLHPVKGIDLLIRAFYQAQLDRDWRLTIAGPSDIPAFEKGLHQLVSNLGLSDRINFPGPIYGSDKFTWMANAWAVVVPSYSEVMAMVNLESAAMQTPTITTVNTGLQDWDESGGLLVEPKVDALSMALQNAAGWTLVERQARGMTARDFVQDRYSWAVVGPRWIKNYQQIVRGEIV